MPPQLTSARRNYALSALISRRAVREASKARPRGAAAVASVVATHQIVQAQTAQSAVAEMLAEQDIADPVEALLNLAGFTTGPADLAAMIEKTADEAAFDRLVESIVTDAARAAESVAVAVRPDIYHVRYVNPPCCGRCAVLAGRVYRWSTGFQRHPGCDCSMIPTTVASPYAQDPEQLVRDGLVRGLSKADLQALADGADLGQIVNVRLRKTGLMTGGVSLQRGDRLTPAGIYDAADGDRETALDLLRRYGYIT